MGDFNFFNPFSSPCEKCDHRHFHCHSECPEYEKYKNDIDEYRKHVKIENQKRDDFLTVRYGSYEQRKKRRGYEIAKKYYKGGSQ